MSEKYEKIELKKIAIILLMHINRQNELILTFDNVDPRYSRAILVATVLVWLHGCHRYLHRFRAYRIRESASSLRSRCA